MKKISFISIILIAFIVKDLTPGNHHIVRASSYGIASQNMLKSSEDPVENQWFSHVSLHLASLLKRVTDGPLERKSIYLTVEDVLGKHLDVDLLLRNIDVPISLLKAGAEECDSLPIDEPAGDGGNGDNRMESTGPTHRQNCKGHSSSSGTEVMIHVMDESVTEHLIDLTSYRAFYAILLISIDASCKTRYLMGVLRTPFLALLCPVYVRALDEETNSSDFKIYSWQPFHPSEKSLEIGTWSPSSILTWSDLFVDRFPSFHGIQLLVSSDYADIPFLFKNSQEKVDGLSKRLMDVLSEWLNFTYTLSAKAKDGRWGAYENGTWTGMLGDVWREVKNLTINSFAITEERSRDFAFTGAYYRAGFGFIMRQPFPLPKWRSLTYPLRLVVWGATGGTLIVTSVVFYLLLRGQHYAISLFNCFFIIIMGLIGGGAEGVPNSLSIRTFLAFWWLGAYIIVVCYTSNLIAILTMPVYPAKLRTTKQLAESSYRLCMLDYGEFVPEALATSTDQNLLALGSKLDLVPMRDTEWFGNEGCINLVLGGGYANLDFYPFLQNLYNVLGYSHRIYSLRDMIYSANIAFFFKKDTPWVYKFDQGIQRVVEANLMQKWYADILRDRAGSSKEEPTESSEKPLSLIHLQGPFLILAIGLIFSSVIFLVEFLGQLVYSLND
ncbi:glutamate receptor ionotropic, kainate glr-3-like [Macrobrachium rosenbergii]|uniref:glutamate receptor ionotropic, kainate glr-3-like n=1 Tax=Macrobrachium rosenbergii TaxID=79674 RepID=UPI0034D3E303